MKRHVPLHVVWWLVSRASGVVALVLITLAVLMGLAMASRTLGRQGAKRVAARLHEHVALTALGAIALHGLSLLGDGWLRPGFRGIAVPFALSYRPAFTGIGVMAGYLAVLVGPSFYLRRRFGAARWRKLHRVSIVIWALAAVHALGAGSDGSHVWLRALVLVPVIPITYLFVLRMLRGKPTALQARGARHAAAAQPAIRPLVAGTASTGRRAT